MAIRGGGFAFINSVIDELLRPIYNDTVVLDVVDSSIMHIIINRIINLQQKPHLEQGVLDFMSDAVSSAVSEHLFTLNDQLFKYHSKH